jgi:hypothetical protein
MTRLGPSSELLEQCPFVVPAVGSITVYNYAGPPFIQIVSVKAGDKIELLHGELVIGGDETGMYPHKPVVYKVDRDE